ncbi:MAG: sigma 54-interacting transcriptional regulator [Proteobacteria bacterium]|nr:sigma 54-interacting transcriptional regulator [Pseudomonadota bacterium]MBU1641025.1 sigma 54-interacting transcriptional regulator [Pseudomonadota bacterium]
MVDLDKQKTAILVVDDEESLRLTFQMFLSREGYGPVEVASTYDDALALIDKQDFDLVVSDIVMDGASGIDLLRTIKEKGVECPVVMVTGYPNINTAAEAVRLGAFDYLAKPVKKEDLLRTARMALQQYTLRNANKALALEKDRYQKYLEAVFRSVPELIFTVDPQRNIAEFNDNTSKWLASFGVDDFSGKQIDNIGSCFDIFVPDIDTVLASQIEVPEHRIEFSPESGQSGVFRVSAVPLACDDGGFMGVVVVAHDVSRLEALEKKGMRDRLHRLIGSSRRMQTVYTLIENVGKVDTTVLINGESGTGKELVAEALHAESPRRDMPLVKVDCTAIPENLLESELFGHKKGSFTGADRDREGRILSADGGTLFLDEIGDISPLMQLRLLRFLQERTFYPVGRDRSITVDVRVVAATNADLREKVKNGSFREDLYYRLKVVDINLPPLRERDEDLDMLVHMFIGKFSSRLRKEITGISDQALQVLRDHDWPGNVRELEHVMERACVLCDTTTITSDHLPLELQEGDDVKPHMQQRTNLLEEEDEEVRIVNTLKRTFGNKAQAARILGFDRSTLYRKLKLYGIDADGLMES